MNKKLKNIKKSVASHIMEVHTQDHHMEITEDFFPTLLDPEGTLADCYIKHLENKFEKNGWYYSSASLNKGI